MYTDYACTFRVDVDLCVKVPHVIPVRGTDRFTFNVSMFELVQLAKSRYELSLLPSSSPHSSVELLSPTPAFQVDELLLLVNSLDTRISLSRLKDSLCLSSSLSFYTDGALKGIGTDDMCMGIGWLLVENEIAARR